MWPKTILPSAVAGPVAAKALQCSGWGRGGRASWGSRKVRPSRPLGVASSALSRKSTSISELTATMSTRSSGRPSNLRPGGGGAVGDALHLLEVFGVVAAEEQGVDQGAHLLPGVVGRGGAALGGQGRDVVGDLRARAAGRADSRARRARPRCGARSSPPADSGTPARSARPTPGRADPTSQPWAVPASANDAARGPIRVMTSGDSKWKSDPSHLVVPQAPPLVKSTRSKALIVKHRGRVARSNAAGSRFPPHGSV